MKRWWLATRPWSFTVSVVPVVLGNVAARLLRQDSDEPWSWATLALTLAGALSVHAAANLTNTYWDFVSGNDRRATASDRTLFDLGLSPRQVLGFSLAAFAVAALIGGYVVVAWGGSMDLLVLFAVGALLAFFYTAEPVRLKARALGDVTILLCYGPLPLLGVFFMQAGRWEWLVPGLLSLAPGLLAVAILHANNTRDLDKDRRARTLTVARLLGSVDNCRRFYVALIVLAYVAVALVDLLLLLSPRQLPGGTVGVVGRSVLLLGMTLLALPMAFRLVRNFEAGVRADTIVEQTAQFHLVFGVLLVVGLLLVRLYEL